MKILFIPTVTVCLLFFRFCNDDIIVEGGDDPAQSDTLILSPAKNGTYRCRAVSPKLTKLSNPATVTVSGSLICNQNHVLILQNMLIYFLNAVFKTPPIWLTISQSIIGKSFQHIVILLDTRTHMFSNILSNF